MSGGLDQVVFVAFTVFCRVGSAMMLIPGFGSARVPAPIRLMMALACGLALMPLLYAPVETQLLGYGESLRVYLLFNEVIIGLSLGLMARLFLLGLQFAATTAANAIGLAGVPGQPVDETEALPPLTNLISLAGVMVLIVGDVPQAMLRAVALSYTALPLRLGVDAAWLLNNFLAVLADTSLLGLRLAGPFVVYALVVNIAMGLANKFTPQIQMYFASLGLVTLGGLILLFAAARPLLSIFSNALSSWIAAL